MNLRFALPLVVASCLVVSRCGTETGNPNVIDAPTLTSVDLDAAVLYFTGSAETGALAKRSSRGALAGKSLQGDGDTDLAPLLKLTRSGKILPALTVEETDDVPRAIRMAKVGADTFVLLDRFVKVGSAFCSLLRLPPIGSAACVDDPAHPAEQRAEDANRPVREDERYFLVAENGGGFLYRGEDKALWRRAGAGIARFGPANWTYERTFVLGSGIYGLNCLEKTNRTTHEYLHCRVLPGEVLKRSAAASSGRRLFFFGTDSLLFVGKAFEDYKHLHIGPVDDFVNDINYSATFDSSMTNDGRVRAEGIVSVLTFPLPLSWAGHYAAIESSNASVCVFRLGASLAAGLDCAPAGYNTLGGIDAQDVAKGLVYSWIKDDHTCQIVRYPLDGSPPPPTLPYYVPLLDCDDMASLPETVRFIADGVFVFGGKEKGANPDRFYYYKYDFATGQATPLIDSPHELHFFPL